MRGDLIIRLALLSSLLVGGVASANAPECPKADKQATPEQVFAARIEAMQRGDFQAIACSYAEDAVVIFPGTVIRGREAIMRAFADFAGVLGGAPPVVTSSTEAGNVLLITYEVHTPRVSIPDGSDTFVIEKGRITSQVVHASLVFHQP